MESDDRSRPLGSQGSRSQPGKPSHWVQVQADSQAGVPTISPLFPFSQSYFICNQHGIKAVSSAGTCVLEKRRGAACSETGAGEDGRVGMGLLCDQRHTTRVSGANHVVTGQTSEWPPETLVSRGLSGNLAVAVAGHPQAGRGLSPGLIPRWVCRKREAGLHLGSPGCGEGQGPSICSGP